MRFRDEQSNYAWYRKRWGKITSTRVQPLVSGSVSTLNSLLDKLWEEWEADEDDIRTAYELDLMTANKYMRWGSLHEEEAISAFEIEYDVATIRPSFIEHKEWPDLVGSSVDAIEVDQDGVQVRSVEVKCPWYVRRHYEYIRERKHLQGAGHRHQTQHHIQVLASHGVPPECRFVSYHPSVEGEDRIYQDIVPALDWWQKQFAERMRVFAKHFYSRTYFGGRGARNVGIRGDDGAEAVQAAAQEGGG